MWLIPVPSTELQPPPPPQAGDDSIPAPSWADVMASMPDPAAAWGDGDVLPPPEPSEELQPPPAPASAAVFPADPEAADVDILKIAPKLQAAELVSGPAADLQLEDQEYAKLPSKEEKYKAQKLPAPDSKQALLKAPPPQFPKKYQPELHKAEGGAKKNLSPKLIVAEQEAAESNFAAVAVGTDEQHLGGENLGGAGHLSGGGERVEFQMHGQNGPNSYKFGFDTGNVHNRQFRYEERDANGHVKGHYGFYDKRGKLQIVNYSADPHTGYHAEPGVVA